MKLLIAIPIFETILAAILFGSAGRLDLPWFWALLAIHTAGFFYLAFKMDPGLRDERLKPGPGGGKDRRFRFLAMPFLLSHLVIAGLDVRYGWTDPLPVAVHAIGLIAYTAGFAFSIWAMVTNRFFSPVVRIQSERGHHVITTGPYRYLRHPGYAGMLTAIVSEAAVFGSWWCLLPVVIIFPALLRRAMREDKFLRQNLAGYAEYAQSTRYGLLPGVW